MQATWKEYWGKEQERLSLENVTYKKDEKNSLFIFKERPEARYSNSLT